ncbi:primary ciliary dyskinesia protein 1 [Clonorchis sinensis]|uniref:Primary ciliary dyskinesia protein 1 n=1 Tax=Clonorchis sinensis TaxID=79923 RepID=G7YCG6_CLOSI|nr:primary ciliary dyskinesia protein 1 [Clonorchis sinensis]
MLWVYFQDIFSKIGKNAFIHVEPAQVFFQIKPTVNMPSVMRTTLVLINVARSTTRVNIVPPYTKYFSLSYKVPKRFVPGARITCRVHFKPTEHRYYEDVILVHTEDHDRNLIIPLYGYPVIEGLRLPQQITLPPVPVGHTWSHTILLKCNSKVDFNFILQKIQDHASFTVNPDKGLLQAGTTQEIRIEFTPTEYTTCRLQLMLKVSQFNFTPQFCTVIGGSEPCLESEKIKETWARKGETSDQSYVILPPLERVAALKRVKKPGRSGMKTKPKEQAPVKRPNTEVDLPQMTCPYHVAKFLLGRQKGAEAESLLLRKRREQQVMEFEAAVRHDATEERRNQVRWQTKLGGQPLTNEQRDRTEDEWIQAWTNYFAQRTDPESFGVPRPDLSGTIPISRLKHPFPNMVYSWTRPHRPIGLVDRLKAFAPTFRTYRLPCQGWADRYRLLDRFRQAVSRIILRRRMTERLRLLQRSVAKHRNSGQQNEDEVPRGILEKIGEPISPLPLDAYGISMPKYWRQRDLIDPVSRSRAPVSTEEDSHDPTELTSSFVEPNRPWPVFQIQDPWQWQIAGCRKFDPLDARNMVFLENEEVRAHSKSVVTFLEKVAASSEETRAGHPGENELNNVDNMSSAAPVEK